MALNPFFIQGTSGEQNLVQDLINEQLRMYGVEVYYLPRSYLTTNTVIEEVIQSSFEDAYPIEAYVQNYEGYDDNSTLLSKFGIQSTQEMTFIISKERFETYITPLTEGKANLKLTSRPKEGDIIYMPLGDRMFEIKFVEHEKPFYQLQKNYVYELRCGLFRYEDEVIDTGVEEIDDTLVGSDTDGISESGSSTVLGGSLTMTLVGTASTATAINITDAGIGYTMAPTITISNPTSSDVGTFVFNELVTGSTSGTKARVRTWNTNTNVLELGNVTGNFKVGETIVGSTSSATHTIFSINNDPVNDGFAQNASIETEADGILDFTERNPFGIP